MRRLRLRSNPGSAMLKESGYKAEAHKQDCHKRSDDGYDCGGDDGSRRFGWYHGLAIYHFVVLSQRGLRMRIRDDGRDIRLTFAWYSPRVGEEAFPLGTRGTFGGIANGPDQATERSVGLSGCV